MFLGVFRFILGVFKCFWMFRGYFLVILGVLGCFGGIFGFVDVFGSF